MRPVSARWAYSLSLGAERAAVIPTTAVCFVAATSATPTGSGPKGAYSQSSGLYAFRQARSTDLCFGVAASSRTARPQAEWP